MKGDLWIWASLLFMKLEQPVMPPLGPQKARGPSIGRPESLQNGVVQGEVLLARVHVLKAQRGIVPHLVDVEISRAHFLTTKSNAVAATDLKVLGDLGDACDLLDPHLHADVDTLEAGDAVLVVAGGGLEDELLDDLGVVGADAAKGAGREGAGQGGRREERRQPQPRRVRRRRGAAVPEKPGRRR